MWVLSLGTSVDWGSWEGPVKLESILVVGGLSSTGVSSGVDSGLVVSVIDTCTGEMKLIMSSESDSSITAAKTITII